MSYNILYRAFAVKNNNDKYLIFTETGDNNVRDAFSDRRSRDWKLSPMIHGRKIEFLSEEYIKNIISEVKFEYGCYAVYGKQKREFALYWAVIKRAIKNAIPLENCTDYATFATYSFDKEYGRVLTTLTEYEVKVAFTYERDLVEENGYLVCNWVNYNAIYPKKQRATNPIPKNFAVQLAREGGYFKRKTVSGYKYSYRTVTFTERRAKQIVEFLENNGVACRIIKFD